MSKSDKRIKEKGLKDVPLSIKRSCVFYCDPEISYKNLEVLNVLFNNWVILGCVETTKLFD